MGSRFHNKFHRQNHHTNPTAGNPDSASDPIASSDQPFQGAFVVNGQISGSSLFAGSLSATELHATSAYIHYQDVLISETSGFTVNGTETSLTVPAIVVPGVNNVALNGVGLTGTNWAAFNGDVETKRNLIVSGIVITPDNISTAWGSVYSSVNSTSGNWDSVFTSVNTTSGNWDSVFTSVNTTSGDWSSTFTTVCANSANWESAFATTSGGVYGVADDINVTYTPVNASYTPTTNDVSGHFDGIDIQGIDWNSVYTTVNSNSASWDSSFEGNLDLNCNNIAGVSALSACQTDNRNAIVLHSNLDMAGYSISGIAAGTIHFNDNIKFGSTEVTDWESTHTSVNSTSGNWDSVYTTVNSTSGDWESTHTTVNSTSGDWESTHTTVSTTSATWAPIKRNNVIILAGAGSRNISPTESSTTFVVSAQDDTTMQFNLSSAGAADLGTWYSFVKFATGTQVIISGVNTSIDDSDVDATIYSGSSAVGLSAGEQNFASIEVELVLPTQWHIRNGRKIWTTTQFV